MRYRVELAIVSLLVLVPFVVGLLVGFRWATLAAGLVLVVLLVGLAHLWGVVVKALKKGGDGGDGAAWAGDKHRQG
jgi:hypothetical protein